MIECQYGTSAGMRTVSVFIGLKRTRPWMNIGLHWLLKTAPRYLSHCAVNPSTCIGCMNNVTPLLGSNWSKRLSSSFSKTLQRPLLLKTSQEARNIPQKAFTSTMPTSLKPNPMKHRLMLGTTEQHSWPFPRPCVKPMLNNCVTSLPRAARASWSPLITRRMKCRVRPLHCRIQKSNLYFQRISMSSEFNGMTS